MWKYTFLFLIYLAPTATHSQINEASYITNDDIKKFLERSNCDANSICGGTLASPPGSCIFADSQLCNSNRYGREKWAEYGASESIDDFFSDDDNEDDTAEYNEVVALINVDAKVYCSGTIISKNAVATAAHCIDNPITHLFVGSRIAKGPSGVLHDGWIFELTEKLVIPIERSSATCVTDDAGQPKPLESEVEFDLGLVKFENNEPLSDSFVGKIFSNEKLTELAHAGRVGAMDYGTIAGFGASESRENGGEKRFATGIALHVGESANSLESTGEPDSCLADSGGPLWVSDTHGFAIFSGVISKGTHNTTSNLCGKGSEYRTFYLPDLGSIIGRTGYYPNSYSAQFGCDMSSLWYLEEIDK